MERGNVLVIGNSGVGKSTLINAVLGEEVAETSWGKAGTSELAIYESEEVPFRVIDTIGFEPSPIKEREQNIEMVKKAFSSKKAMSKRLRGIIPVVAEAYPISEDVTVPPYGVAELIELTNELMPEGIKAAENDIDEFVLNRKRAMAQGVIVPSVATGAAVGALPIPIADAAVLGAVEAAEVGAIAKVYGIDKDDKSKALIEAIVNVGTVSVAAKGAISMLKAVPGINVAAEVLNAVVAGCIVAALGEGCAYVFERIYVGEKDVTDIEWVEKLLEAQLSSEFVDKVVAVINSLGDKVDAQTIAKVIGIVFGTDEKARH